MKLTEKQLKLKRMIPLALKRARENSGLTPKQAATKAGIDKQTVENHEKGEHWPSMDYFLAALETYGIDFGRFHELLLEVDFTLRLEAKIDMLAKRVFAVEQSGK